MVAGALLGCYKRVAQVDLHAALGGSPVGVLPEELLRAVLLRAGPADLARSICRTCRLFHGWLRQDAFWLDVCAFHSWADRVDSSGTAPPGPGSLWPVAIDEPPPPSPLSPRRPAGRDVGPWQRCVRRCGPTQPPGHPSERLTNRPSERPRAGGCGPGRRRRRCTTGWSRSRR